MRRIDQDHDRFRRIIKRQLKKDLGKYISGQEYIVRKGSKKFSVRIPYIDIPTFKYKHKEVGGVGSGEGEEGTVIGIDEEGAGSKAGNMGGEWIEEVEVSLEEWAQILGEELELPNVQPKGKKNVSSEKVKFTGLSRSGPESLRHIKRTMREALKRELKEGTYDFKKPKLVPIKEDKRFRSWKVKLKPEMNAVIFYVMDISGSMEENKKTFVRLACFWIDLWLKYQYKDIDRRFIVHHDAAKEVDENLFFRLTESGGTMPSTAFKIVEDIITNEHPANDWNIYIFYFSDGDVWETDYKECFGILDRIIPSVNLFAYGQTDPFGVGWGGHVHNNFIHEITERYESAKNVVTAFITKPEEIQYAIKTFLGKGA